MVGAAFYVDPLTIPGEQPSSAGQAINQPASKPADLHHRARSLTLIELKQVVALANPSEASRKAVAEAVAAARGEVERYRGHIATRPQWAGLLPVIVVVHTCIEDLSDLEATDVVLIDLSTASPSRKKPQRV
jgi:hypothetical protein